MRKELVDYDYQVQQRIDELLAEAGDAPWQREMRQLEERLAKGERLTKKKLWQLWEGLVGEEERLRLMAERKDDGWLRQERWAGTSGNLDVIEGELGMGLE